MGLLQSLGLAGASKAVRRLLRRSSPAATASPPRDSQNATLKAAQAPTQAVTDSHQQVESAPSPRNETKSPTGHRNDSMLSPKASNLGRTPQVAGCSAGLQQKDQIGVDTEANNKENQQPGVDGVTEVLAGVDLGGARGATLKPQVKNTPSIYESEDPAIQAEKARHQRFTEEALDMVSCQPVA